MEYLAKFKEAKEKRNLTYTEIAQIANVPHATVTRIFGGGTANPSLDNLIPIAIALGISLDEVFGLSQPEIESVPTAVSTTLDSYAELLKEKDDRIKELKEEKEKERKEKHKLAFALGIFVGFVLIILTIDILNGHFGYFRY